MVVPSFARARIIPEAPVEYRMPVVLKLPIGAMPELILHRRCPCPTGAWGMMPMRLLVRRHGRSCRLGDLLPRFICRHCHRRPTILLAETVHTHFCGGEPPGWSVVLVTAEELPGDYAASGSSSVGSSSPSPVLLTLRDTDHSRSAASEAGRSVSGPAEPSSQAEKFSGSSRTGMRS